jgi:hypothetical protein
MSFKPFKFMKLSSFVSALVGFAVSASAAAPIVLYETGFEAAPASPAWAIGNVFPQNGWFNYAFGTWNPASLQVAGNGLPGAVIGGQAVVTPYGSQFHRFTASTATTAENIRFVYPDISANVAALPATHKVIKASMDFFVPSTQAGVAAAHGFIAWHGNGAGPWGVLIDPSDRSVNMALESLASFPFEADAFEFDTWFNVTVTANYETAQISVAVDGVELSSLTRTGTAITTGALVDVDLTTWNWNLSAAPLRSIAGDNFRIIAESAAPVLPRLTMAPIPPDNLGYRIKWPAANSNWILEYTDALVDSGSDWSPQGTVPTPDGVDPLLVYVDIGIEALHRYFRLRQP